MKLSSAPYYDHATHLKCSNIPNLVRDAGKGGSFWGYIDSSRLHAGTNQNPLKQHNTLYSGHMGKNISK